jgi:hypothetical protein
MAFRSRRRNVEGVSLLMGWCDCYGYDRVRGYTSATNGGKDDDYVVDDDDDDDDDVRMIGSISMLAGPVC